MRPENPSVNRYLSDNAMDHIDHALGRPIWPLRESYRNYFATDVRSDLASAFNASFHWELRNVTPDAMAFYSVTDAGRNALADYLDGLDVGERHQAYAVTFEGQTCVVPAKSRAHARYSEWLSISDCFCDLTFADFIKRSQVRNA
jgi:hypothetical protein